MSSLRLTFLLIRVIIILDSLASLADSPPWGLFVSRKDSTMGKNAAVQLTPNRFFAARVAIQALDLLAEYEPRLRSFPDASMRFENRTIEDPDILGVGLGLILRVDKAKSLDFAFTINHMDAVIRTTIVVTLTLGHQERTYYGHATDYGDGRTTTEIDPPTS